MDILINKPIKISLDTIDTDEHLPSIEFDIQINIQKMGYLVDISYNTWIECDVFDTFIRELKSSKTTSLYDMDENFKLQIDVQHNQMLWSVVNSDLEGNISKNEGVAHLDFGDIASIIEAFNQYPKWW